jgi:hypothetical protein
MLAACSGASILRKWCSRRVYEAGDTAPVESAHRKLLGGAEHG